MTFLDENVCENSVLNRKLRKISSLPFEYEREVCATEAWLDSKGVGGWVVRAI